MQSGPDNNGMYNLLPYNLVQYSIILSKMYLICVDQNNIGIGSVLCLGRDIKQT